MNERLNFNKFITALHVQLFATPCTVARQAPLFMECFRQENWSGLPFPISWDLPTPGIKASSLEFLALEGFLFFPLVTPGKPALI